MQKGWFYEYETEEKYRRRYNCELTDVRYVLGGIAMLGLIPIQINAFRLPVSNCSPNT